MKARTDACPHCGNFMAEFCPDCTKSLVSVQVNSGSGQIRSGLASPPDTSIRPPLDRSSWNTGNKKIAVNIHINEAVYFDLIGFMRGPCGFCDRCGPCETVRKIMSGTDKEPS